MCDLFGIIHEFLPIEDKYNLICAYPFPNFLKQYAFDNDITFDNIN